MLNISNRIAINSQGGLTGLAKIVSDYGYLNAWSTKKLTISGTDTTYIDYAGEHDLVNPSAANQPTYSASDSDINNKPSLTYATVDYNSKVYSNYRSGDSTGVIDCVFRTGADVTSPGVQFASSKIVNGEYIGIYYINGKLKVVISNTTNAADRYLIDCNTTAIAINSNYVVSVQQNGTDLAVWINGVSQSFTVVAGTAQTYWFADVSTRLNIVIGAILTPTKTYCNDTKTFVGYRPYVSNAITLNGNTDLKTHYGI